jgi:flagellar biosynthesis/type III secretory pathway M-ring protein FliF/YscJ
MSNENEHAVNPMSSVSRDLKNARVNSTSVAVEVREFLAQMQGKSPQEMLGMIAQSSLIKCTVQAVGVMVAILVIFTIIPFGLTKMGGASGKASAQAAPAGEQSADPKTASDEPKAESAATEPETLKEKDDLLDKLGVGETKVAPAKENPLDGGGDDLFKDLE